ncbi:hypothetical protein HaLaN_24389, partial [Haematococcus lacustris]
MCTRLVSHMLRAIALLACILCTAQGAKGRQHHISFPQLCPLPPMGTQAPSAIDRCGLPLQKLHLLYLWRLPLLPGPPH